MKRFYARTNKVQFVHQITKQQRCVELLHRIQQHHIQRLQDASGGQSISPQPIPPLSPAPPSLLHSSIATDPALHAAVPAVPSDRTSRPVTRPKTAATLDFTQEDPLEPTNPAAHHEMSRSTRHHLDIATWTAEHDDDPAIKVSTIRDAHTSTTSPSSQRICRVSYLT